MKAKFVFENLNLLSGKTGEQIGQDFEDQLEVLLGPGENVDSYVQQIKDEVGSDDEDEILEEFVMWVSGELPSALEIWMTPQRQKELWEKFQEGWNIASFSGDTDEIDDPYELAEMIQEHTDWEEFEFEENGSSFELILVKPPNENS